MATKKANEVKATKKTNEVKAKDVKKKKKKEKLPKVEIIRGRMPLPIVHMIKFGSEGETAGALSRKFRTTVGKINDIQKESNFGYIKEDYKPSADMIEKAKEYAAQLEDKSILEAVEKLEAATEEENAAFIEARRATRKVSEKKEKKEEEVAEMSEENLDELTV